MTFPPHMPQPQSENDVASMLTRLIVAQDEQRGHANMIVAELRQDRAALNALTATQGHLTAAVASLAGEIKQERIDRKADVEKLKAEDDRLTQRIKRISREQVWSLFWRAAVPATMAMLTVMGAFFQTFPDVWARWADLLGGP